MRPISSDAGLLVNNYEFRYLRVSGYNTSASSFEAVKVMWLGFQFQLGFFLATGLVMR